MKNYRLLIALFFSTAVPTFALQGNTPQAALAELATTNKPEVIARHLPGPVEKSIEILPRSQKQRVMDKLLSMKNLQFDECTIRPARDADAWEVVDSDGEIKGRVILANTFISGLDAILPLRFESEDGSQSFIVSMHLEGDEWRIDEFGPWEKRDLGLRKLVHQPTQMEKNETAAKETLSKLSEALHSYAGRVPRIGFPSSLRALTVPIPVDVPPAMRRFFGPLLEDSYAVEPQIKDGYQFRYLLTGTGNGEENNPGTFELTAIPIEFGITGSKSFFLAPYGPIRVTTENRPATATDPRSEDD